MVQEYKRTCTQCGQVWHSLKSREKQLQIKKVSNSFGYSGGAANTCATCGMCGGTTSAQYSRNIDADQAELDRLKSCPKCGSHNYTEELIGS